MKVAEIRGILEEVAQVYAAAGAKAPASDMETLADALKNADESDFDRFIANLEENFTNPADRHMAALNAAGLNDARFEIAFAKLNADKTLKLADLDKIGSTFTKSPHFAKLYKTRAAKLKQIRHVFQEMKDFESRGKVIDQLMPWQ